ncbi:MAG: hypothetical protein ACREWJ_14860 [Rhodoferax sp.]
MTLKTASALTLAVSATLVGTSTNPYLTSSGANKGGTGGVLGALYTF